MSQELLVLNNEGVLLLQQNNFQGAMSCFSRALYLSSETTAVSPTGGNNETLSSSNADDMMVAGIPLLVTDEPARDVSPEHFVLYDRAFAFTSDSYQESDSGKELKVASVILYNLALAYHLLGLATGSKQDERAKNFQAAIRCYRCSLNMIRDSSSGTDSDIDHGEAFSFLLSLACLNNLSHVFSRHDRLADAQVCRTMLDCLLDSMTTPAAQPSHPLAEEDFVFFYLGQFYRSHGFVPSAAAAA